MEEFEDINTAEFSYGRKNEGRTLLLKILAIAGYALFVAVYFILCLVAVPIQVFALAPIFTWILVFFTWRFVSYDYYFEFRSGVLRLGKVRSKKKKEQLIVRVKEAEDIIRYTGDAAALGDVVKIYNYSSSKASECRIAVIYNENGKRAALVFECTTKCASMLALFNNKAMPLKGQKFHG